jgi:hypothetical protein
MPPIFVEVVAVGLDEHRLCVELDRLAGLERPNADALP